jgi:hypothetical protein
VYDLLGKEVATLVNEKVGAGRYAKTFNADGLASGVYICRMKADDFAATKKILLLH